jgi:uroporphyrinogen decarboxylase
MKRREFLLAPAAARSFAGHAAMTPRERVDRALAGKTLDRPPFTLWYHFGLEKKGPEAHAEATLSFHRRFSTDLVKVMSDFPYPKPGGQWWELREEASPFAPQIRALEIIRGGLGGRAHFVETIFNPWNVAEKLSSKEEVARMMAEQPQRLLDALGVIAKSEANHARKAVAAGASGVFLAIANAQEGILTREQYGKFSAPFDRMVLEAAAGAPLNTLHLHGDKVYLDLFWKGWPAAAINYSAHGTGTAVAAARKQYGGLLLAGIDERNYRSLKPADLRSQIAAARREGGAKLVVTPGCSVPNETTDEEALRLSRLLA